MRSGYSIQGMEHASPTNRNSLFHLDYREQIPAATNTQVVGTPLRQCIQLAKFASAREMSARRGK
jgi:hypothetical protein